MASDSAGPARRDARPRLFLCVGLCLASGPIAGCARDRSEITPTTMGTDFSEVPAGRMVPQPFPGSSLSWKMDRADGDPAVRTAGISDATRR